MINEIRRCWFGFPQGSRHRFDRAKFLNAGRSFKLLRLSGRVYNLSARRFGREKIGRGWAIERSDLEFSSAEEREDLPDEKKGLECCYDLRVHIRLRKTVSKCQAG